MSDKRHHRGAHPEDAELFAPPMHPRLQAAVADLSWLLTRAYAPPSALKVVGDRYELTARQRMAVMRCACSDEARLRRRQSRVDPAALPGAELLIDGYNVLTTVEAALAGGVVIVGRDGAWRDVASMHGTWRKVEETAPALQLVGGMLEELRVGRCRWYLDSPVSNSGRLKEAIADVGRERGWAWEVELVANPDAVLSISGEIVATADSVILDRCQRWVELAGEVVRRCVPAAWVVPMGRHDE